MREDELSSSADELLAKAQKLFDDEKNAPIAKSLASFELDSPSAQSLSLVTASLGDETHLKSQSLPKLSDIFSDTKDDTIFKDSEPSFDESYDVIVVGSGFAGLAAALRAAGRGLSVLVVEKMGRIGGNSVINGGAMAVVNNPVQAKTGIKDSKELFINDCLKAGRGINHTELLEVIASRSDEAYKFLLDCGVQFKQTHCAHFGGHSVPRSLLITNDSGSGII